LGSVLHFDRTGPKYGSRHAWTYQDLRSVDYFDRRGLRYISRHAWTFQDMNSVDYLNRKKPKSPDPSNILTVTGKSMNQDMHGHIKTYDPSTILTVVLGSCLLFWS
jgi:hypothetical protein